MWTQNLGMCGAFGGGMEGDLTYLNSEVSSIWRGGVQSNYPTALTNTEKILEEP